MKISIHDYENSRVIIAEVPQYLIDAGMSTHDMPSMDAIALAIIEALGLSTNSCEYMFGDFDVHVSAVAISSIITPTGLGELSTKSRAFMPDFKADALAALKESQE